MIGKTVGNFRITAKLGAGGMGEVFLAEDIRLDRKAAIKLLPSEFAADPLRRQRFIDEAKAASALNHPHVCVVYDVGETDDGHHFIAMEFVEGQTLEDLLRKGPIEIAKVVEIAVQVADALDAAHASRIVHRDIKPANISINDRRLVKVLDFGLAKRLPHAVATEHHLTVDAQRTQDGQILGTPSYMSPEQALGKPLDHRTDIFSLGVVLYELLTGRLPFTGSSFSEIINKIVNSQPPAIARLNYDVPPELERIVLKCLQKSVDSRYQSARELMIDLKNLARELESRGEPVGPRDSAIYSGHTMELVPAKADLRLTESAPGDSLQGSDILLTYAPIDDQPLNDGKPGWVSQLHRNLEVRVEQLSGEKVKIARLPGSTGSDVLNAEVLEHFGRAKAMVSVISPPFIKSEICRRKVEEFCRIAEHNGGRWIDDKSRLLKVVKTAVTSREMPPGLADIFSPLFGFEFYDIDTETGRVREFDESFGPAQKQRFFERVYDLAHDICQTLRVVRAVATVESIIAPAAANRQWIYLATSTSDVQDERDRIRRELLERGHAVLPDTPLPMMSRDVEAFVQECLAKCTMAIHLLGKHYGVTPEDSAESIPALQLRMSAEQTRRQPLQRLIWIPPPSDIVNEQQITFLRRVREDDKLHYQAEIIEGNLNLLKKDLIRRLTPEEKKPSSIAIPTANSAPKLYLICDARDESAIESLEDYLFSQGIEVGLPAFDGSESDAEALHRENLTTCNAVMIYYGAAPKAWVDIKLRELLKAAGYGRPEPIPIQAVYVAPPDDHRKERFRSLQAQVIRQLDAFDASSELDAFVQSMKATSA